MCSGLGYFSFSFLVPDLISASSYYGLRSYSWTSIKYRLVSNVHFSVHTYVNFYLIELFLYIMNRLPKNEFDQWACEAF